MEPTQEPTLSDLGEFAVIDRILAGRRSRALLGPGDDAAVLTAPDGRVVVSTDMLVEGRHFRLDWSTPGEVGRKAIAQNVADIEAMGARPTGFLVAFGAPADTPIAMVDDLAKGMWEEASRAGGAEILGGDLVSCPQWVLGITAIGDLAGMAPVTLSGARPGSSVAVCGHLGRSAAGYALWERSFDGFEQLRAGHLVPAPPYGQGAAAARGGATAMTDISDGLVADLRHIADASRVGIELSTSALASDHAALAAAGQALGADAWAWILGGGEDHALVAAFEHGVPDGWRVIGSVVAGPARVLVDGAEWSGSPGWESFE
ncbi:MAG: thiamine-monophosphate kinase [Mycobacterium sp.]|jgi:thiamine-monophosphate kinase|nr:thiamine-monophosphate kinase [Mycobacterium sp.]